MSQSSRQEQPQITLFGDSLTAWSFDTVHGRGIGDVLAERFEGRARVENEGLCFSLSVSLFWCGVKESEAES